MAGTPSVPPESPTAPETAPASDIAPAPPRAGLRRRVAKGGAWTVVGLGAHNVIRLASNLLLTRLLAPEAFGVMSITIAVGTWLNMLSDFGIKPSIIRSVHGGDPKFLGTAFTVQIIRSTGLALLIAVAALGVLGARMLGLFPAASVYSDPRLPSFLLILAASQAANGFTSLRLILKERDLDMVPVIRLDLISQVATVAAIVVLAMLDFGAHSLVVGTAFGGLVKTIGSHLWIDGPRVSLGVHKDHFREILGYGRWLVVASIFGFLINRGGEMILGYYMDQTTFSLYAIGAMWVASMKQIVQQPIQKVGYPLFSEVARERPRDRTRIYYRLRAWLDVATVAAVVVAYFGSEAFFEALYASSYHGVARYVQLTVVGLFFVPFVMLNVIILSGGDSRRYTVVTVVPGVAILLGVPLSFHLGGADVAILFVAMIQLFALPFTWHFARRTVRLSLWREAPLVLVALAASVVLALFGHGAP